MLARISCSILAAGAFAEDVVSVPVVNDVQDLQDASADPDFVDEQIFDPDTVSQFDDIQAKTTEAMQAMQGVLEQAGLTQGEIAEFYGKGTLPAGYDDVAADIATVVTSTFQGAELPAQIATMLSGISVGADDADDKDEDTIDLDWAKSFGFEAKDCEAERGDTKCEKELSDGRKYECELEGEDKNEWKCEIDRDECRTKDGSIPFLVSECDCRGCDKEKLPGIFKELAESLSSASTEATSDAETVSDANATSNVTSNATSNATSNSTEVSHAGSLFAASAIAASVLVFM